MRDHPVSPPILFSGWSESQSCASIIGDRPCPSLPGDFGLAEAQMFPPFCPPPANDWLGEPEKRGDWRIEAWRKRGRLGGYLDHGGCAAAAGPLELPT